MNAPFLRASWKVYNAIFLSYCFEFADGPVLYTFPWVLHFYIFLLSLFCLRFSFRFTFGMFSLLLFSPVHFEGLLIQKKMYATLKYFNRTHCVELLLLVFLLDPRQVKKITFGPRTCWSLFAVFIFFIFSN